MSPAAVRPAQLSDLYSIRLLLSALFESLPGAYPYPTPQDMELLTAQLAARLAREDPTLFCRVAELDGEIIGFMLGDRLVRLGQPHHYLFLSAFYVSPAHRGHGVGRALSEVMLRDASATGIEVCEFIAQAGDKQWRQRGWATVGIVHALPVDQAACSLAIADRDHPNGDSKIPAQESDAPPQSNP